MVYKQHCTYHTPHGCKQGAARASKLDLLWILHPLPLRQEPPEGRRRRTFVVVVAVVFYFLKVSKVYVFLKFFNFWPLYLLLELRSPRTLPDSPGLPLDTFGSRVWDPKPQTVR